MRHTTVVMFALLLAVPAAAAGEPDRAFLTCDGDSFGPIGDDADLVADLRLVLSNTAPSAIEAWVCLYVDDTKYFQQRLDLGVGDAFSMTVPIRPETQSLVLRARDQEGAIGLVEYELRPRECHDQTADFQASAVRVAPWMYWYSGLSPCAQTRGGSATSPPGGDRTSTGAMAMDAGNPTTRFEAGPAVAVAASTLTGFVLLFLVGKLVVLP
ncbi:MAG TPA: hypothetical protein VGB18_06960, partial [Candidatus Thermoplasmatota archaeon]